MSVMVPPTDAERPHIEHGPRGVRLGSNYAMVLDAASRLPALIWTNMMLAFETQGMWSDKSASTESTDGKMWISVSPFTGKGHNILVTTREDPKDH